jgi:hypothetical protein
MVCKRVVEFKCPKIHVEQRRCHKFQPASCRQCERDDERQRKQLVTDIEIQDRRDKAQAEHRAEMADLDRQIRMAREQATDRKTAIERSHALEQMKRDLDAAKRLAQAVQPPKKNQEVDSASTGERLWIPQSQVMT